MWLKPILVPFATWLDDRNGNGRLNTIKKWWLDHEVVDEITMEPQVGTNRRDIDPGANIDPTRQKMANYPATAMPPPDTFKPRPTRSTEKPPSPKPVEWKRLLRHWPAKRPKYRHENTQVWNKERILRWSPAVAAPNSLLRNPTD